MKKLLLLLLIPCLLLCSCNVADSGDTTTADETTEETTTETVIEEIVEPPRKYMTRFEDYETFLQHKYLRDDFVTAEDVSEFGEFGTLTLGYAFASNPEDTWFDAYRYVLVLEERPLQLSVYHCDAVDNLPIYTPEEERTPENSRALPPKSDTDMRYYIGKDQYSSEYSGLIWVGDVEYYYLNGYLYSIKWKIDDILFDLVGAHSPGWLPLYELNPDTASPMLRDLLNAETAEAAIERFAAKLRGKTNADGE